MAPETKSKLSKWIGISGSLIGLASLLFVGGGFYYQTNDTNKNALPALRNELKEHITNHELFKDRVIDMLNEIKTQQAVQNQKIDDVKETVKAENQKTIKAVKSEQ